MARKSFVEGTVILMAAGLAVRVLGFIYRVFISNLIGAEGMGLFQLISPVYSLIIMTLTSGISIAVSKMVAEEVARKNYRNIGRIIYVAFFTVLAAGIFISVIMFLNVDFISDTLLKDGRTNLSILVLIPCIPAVAAAAALKGYYYGVQQMGPTAVSAICEQVTKMAIVMMFIGRYAEKGVEYACAMAVLGSAAGEIMNLLVLLVHYKFRKNIFPADEFRKSGITRKRIILKELLTVSVPVPINKFILSALGTVEMILIPRMLMWGGLDYTRVMEEYGKLTGMAMPLVFFPSLMTSALATSLVPAVSEAVSLRNFRMANYRISKSIQFTFVIGFIFTAVFLTFPHEIGNLVYKNAGVGDILFMLAFTCVLLYLSQTLLGTLNGLGRQNAALRNSVIGYAVRIAVIFLYVPSHGIKGYVAGMVVSSFLVSVLNIWDIVKTTGMVVNIKKWVYKPLVVTVLMCFAGKYFSVLYGSMGMGHTLNVVLSVASEAAIMFLLLMMIGAVDKKDVKRLAPLKK